MVCMQPRTACQCRHTPSDMHWMPLPRRRWAILVGACHLCVPSVRLLCFPVQPHTACQVSVLSVLLRKPDLQKFIACPGKLMCVVIMARAVQTLQRKACGMRCTRAACADGPLHKDQSSSAGATGCRECSVDSASGQSTHCTVSDDSRVHAVAPAVQGMQDAVHQGLDAQAASLTANNTALLELIAQLEQLGTGDAVLQLGRQPPRQCQAPCVDLRQHPILHSSACVCAAGALGGMQAAAERAAGDAAQAIVGEHCRASSVRDTRLQVVSIAQHTAMQGAPCGLAAAPWPALLCMGVRRMGAWENACRRRHGVRGCCVESRWLNSWSLPTVCYESKALPGVSSCTCILSLAYSERY